VQDRKEPHAEEALGRSALVVADVGDVGADHRAVGLRERHEREDVRGGPVEDEVRRDLAAEEAGEGFPNAGGPRVVAVGAGVAAVAGDERLQDARVDAGEVVAGEAARKVLLESLRGHGGGPPRPDDGHQALQGYTSGWARGDNPDTQAGSAGNEAESTLQGSLSSTSTSPPLIGGRVEAGARRLQGKEAK
jgi:hypothetical protein